MNKIMKILIAFVAFFSIINVPSVYATESVQLHSQYAYCYDRETSLVYIDQKSEEKIFPASMTKVLTVSLALNKISNLKEIVTITKEDLEGLKEMEASVAGFSVGEKVTYEDLLYGALLPSGADACNALARLTYGSHEKMVAAMNDTIQQLNLKNTHFTNVTGLHDEQHYTTVKDMAMILNHALYSDDFIKIFEARTYKSSKKNHEWISSLERGKEYKKIDISNINGGKSGFTDEAGLTFASTMTIDNHHIILVTAKAEGQYSQNHVKDAVAVYEYMNKNYHNVVLYKKDEEIESFWVLKSFQFHYTQKALKDISILTDKSIEKTDLEITVEKENIQFAPIQKGNTIGKVIVQHNQKKIYEYTVSASQDIQSSFIIIAFSCILIILVFLICLLFISRKIFRIKRRRAKKNKNKS